MGVFKQSTRSCREEEINLPLIDATLDQPPLLISVYIEFHEKVSKFPDFLTNPVHHLHCMDTFPDPLRLLVAFFYGAFIFNVFFSKDWFNFLLFICVSVAFVWVSLEIEQFTRAKEPATTDDESENAGIDPTGER